MSSLDSNEVWTSVVKAKAKTKKEAKISKSEAKNDYTKKTLIPAQSNSTWQNSPNIIKSESSRNISRDSAHKDMAAESKPEKSVPPPQPKKTKRQSEGMALMDIIEAQLKAGSVSREKSSKKKNVVSAKAIPAKTYHPSDIVKMVRSKDPTNTEFRVVTKKKKKKLSTVKKRVLMVGFNGYFCLELTRAQERLNRHVKQMIESGFITSFEQSNFSVGGSVVALLNFLTEDVVDADEMDEMLRDAAELLSPFGSVLDMRCHPPVLPNDYLQPDQALALQGCSELHVTFASPTEAFAAACALDGLIIGGEAICTRLVGDVPDSSHFRESSFDYDHGKVTEEEAEHKIAVPRSDSDGSRGGGHAVDLWNVVLAEDIVDADEAEEVLADICFLCEAYGSPTSATIIESKDFILDKVKQYVPGGYAYMRAGSGMLSSITAPVDDPSLVPPVAFVRCSDVEVAIKAATKIQGIVLGGQTISVAMYDTWALDRSIYRQSHLIQLPMAGEQAVTLREGKYGLRVWLASVESFPLDRAGVPEMVRAFVLERLTAGSGSSSICIQSITMQQLLELVNACDVYVPSVSAGSDHPDACDVIVGQFSFDICLALQQAMSLTATATESFPSGVICVRFDVCEMTCIQPTSVWQRDHSLHTIQTIARGICHGDSGGADYIFSSECVLAVRGFISEDDVLDAVAFPEEIAALKAELMELLGLFTRGEGSGTGWSYCKGCTFVTADRAKVSEDKPCMLEWAATPYVHLEFATPEEARNVMFAFDGSVMSGEVVMAQLTENISDSLRRYSLKTIASTATDHKACDIAQPVTPAAAPKLPRHTTPIDSDIPLLGEEGNAVAKEMLQTLSVLQQRAKEKDPVNYKKKERFVMGLKQAANTVKSGRARLLLLAPDTEESDVLDSKITGMLAEAREKEIPVVYSLKRRQLGKAAGVTMKQSVISICNIDGVEKQFKFLVDIGKLL